jgi:hypothetical protein
MADTSGSLEPKFAPASKREVHMAGLLVDVYGLDELPQPTRKVSCLWVHHGRLGSKADWTGFADRVIAAWNSHRTGNPPSPPNNSGGSGESCSRGLIVMAFDQRNHGSRLVHELANSSWRDGNAMHAIDMFGAISGMVSDTRGLMDVVEGYLFQKDGVKGEEEEGGGTIDQHLVMGISLGGHSAWQTLFAEERVTAGVVIIGCPDYMCKCLARLPLFEVRESIWREVIH